MQWDLQAVADIQSHQLLPIHQGSARKVSHRFIADRQIPSVWGPLHKGEDPYSPVEAKGCCSGTCRILLLKKSLMSSHVIKLHYLYSYPLYVVLS